MLLMKKKLILLLDEVKKNKTILSVSTHDRRDIEPELNFFLNRLEKVSKKYPKVKD